MLKNLSLVVGAALLLAACGASTSEELSAGAEPVGTVEGAVCAYGCDPGYHVTSRTCSSSCLPYPCGSGVVNSANCAVDAGTYWQCGVGCASGFHQTSLKCDPSNCGSYNCSNPVSVNMAQCAPNSDDFYQCAGNVCPTGYSQTEWKCDPTSECGPCSNFGTGWNVRRCVKY